VAIRISKRSDDQALSHFLSNSSWIYENLSRTVRTKAVETIGTNGIIILDESSMEKSGDSSVGVSRQYCGNLGKVENCQVGVFVSSSNSRVKSKFPIHDAYL
jgi:SRSO17 transposase